MSRLTSLVSLFCDIAWNQSRKSLENTILYGSLCLLMLIGIYSYFGMLKINLV